MDEPVAEVTIDTGAMAQAEMDAKSAAMGAELAAHNADVAAAAAVGATVAQGQLIGQVMEHAREDARESAGDAEQAAQESEQAAEVAVAVNAMTAEQYMEICKRLDALESRNAEKESEPSSPAIAEITPETEGGEGETSEGESGIPEQTTSRAGKKRHGRRGR